MLATCLIGSAAFAADTTKDNPARGDGNGKGMPGIGNKIPAQPAGPLAPSPKKTEPSASPAPSSPSSDTDLRFLSGDLMPLFAGVILLAVLSFIIILYLMKLLKKTDQPHAVDLEPLNQALTATNNKVDALVKSVWTLSTSQGKTEAAVGSMTSSLPAKLVDTLARAIKESPLGELAQRCEKLEAELERARSEAESRNQADSRRLEEVFQLSRDLEAVRLERDRLTGESNQLRNMVESVKANLGEERAKLDRANAETAKEREVSAALRKEAQLCFAHLAPAKLMGGELEAQIRESYQLAMAGDAPSVAVWSTLTSFGSAQADPGAKDFQLQIVRRLGIVLVLSWKHNGLNEKERHEQLSVWAKFLNDHADGRYNLFVPGLGTPIDRARMACASTATTVSEVLCWQVRNSVGANFSLAEVA
jgi:hypothetical protein